MNKQMKYQIYISDYQPFMYFNTLKSAREILKRMGYSSFQYAKFDTDIRLYVDGGRIVWL